MGIVLVWILISILLWPIANNRGRNGAAWFVLSLLISPLLALLFLLASKDLSSTKSENSTQHEPQHKDKIDCEKLSFFDQEQDEKKCIFCAETIKKEAVVCRFCNRDLHPWIKDWIYHNISCVRRFRRPQRISPAWAVKSPVFSPENPAERRWWITSRWIVMQPDASPPF